MHAITYCYYFINSQLAFFIVQKKSVAILEFPEGVIATSASCMNISVGAGLHSIHSATMSDVSDTEAYKTNLKNIIRFIIVLVMVAAFLYQMWELFGQFLSGLTTVATSFEEKEEFDLPSFAFCDSRAFTRSVSMGTRKVY